MEVVEYITALRESSCVLVFLGVGLYAWRSVLPLVTAYLENQRKHQREMTKLLRGIDKKLETN